MVTSRRSGFTIVELVIVIVIIAVLAAISIVAYSTITSTARDNAVLSDADLVEGELARYSTQHSGIYGSALQWYSGGSVDNANINIQPSTGNIIDVVATDTSYCIRVYNPGANKYKTLATAWEKGLTATSCSALAASTEALEGSGPLPTNLGWTAQSGSGVRDWSSIAGSSDGTKLVAGVSNGGYLYTSTDSGTTWTARTGPGSNYWTSVASSSDGTKLLASYGTGIPGSYLYRSTDSGATWTQVTAAGQRQSWSVVASSADGTKLYAGACFSYLYRSTDSGATWAPITSLGNRCWSAGGIAMSSGGTKVAVTVEGSLQTSTDSGVTWTDRGSTAYWISVAMSSDGSKMLIAGYDDYLHFSTDGGFSLVPLTNSGTRYWISTAISSNGSRMAAGVDEQNDYNNPTGYIYTSIDGGNNWQEEATPGAGSWRALTMSANGLKLAAGSYIATYANKPIYTGVYTP